MVVTWLENRTLNFDVLYEQLAINGLILCPLTLVGALTSVLTPEEAGCQRGGAGSAPLLSAQLCVPVPRMNFADSDLLSLSTHSSHWTPQDKNDSWHGAVGSPGSGAGSGGSCGWRGEQRPALASPFPRLRLLEHVCAVVGVVGRVTDKKRFPRLVFKAIFVCAWLSGWLMWIGKYCWPI